MKSAVCLLGLLVSIQFDLLSAGHDTMMQQTKNEKLKSEIEKIASSLKADIGVALLNIEKKEILNYNGNLHLVLHSVFKFPIAITVLHLIDKKKFSLDQKIHISKSDLPLNYSPLRDKFPAGDIDINIGELLGYVISLSDNDVCDILLSKVTSKAEVEDYMHSLGINEISIGASEIEMQKNWDAQFDNWASPLALLHLIDITWNGKILSKSSHDFLWKIMNQTSTGSKRIRGLLPGSITVGHKTGTSATNEKGLSPATNDIGVISLPNGNHLAIVVMIGNSTDNMDTREKIIARIAKAAFDTYSK